MMRSSKAGKSEEETGLKAAQRVQRIKAELATCRQQGGDSVEDYYGKLMKLWTGQSNKTTCCHVEREEEDKLHEFLKGLDESLYGSVKSNLLCMDPLPSLDEAYTAVLQDEKHTSNDMASANLVTSADRIGRTGLNDEQWRTLDCMLNERRKQESPGPCLDLDSWIVDSGATNHMTCSLRIMSDISGITPPVPIRVADGRITFAYLKGRVVLSSTLTLENVLFVYELKHHFLSVSQLNREQQTMFQITDKICLIRNSITRSLIGVAELSSNGLYFVRRLELAPGAVHHVESVVSRDSYVSPPPSRALAFNFKLFFRCFVPKKK